MNEIDSAAIRRQELEVAFNGRPKKYEELNFKWACDFHIALVSTGAKSDLDSNPTSSVMHDGYSGCIMMFPQYGTAMLTIGYRLSVRC